MKYYLCVIIRLRFCCGPNISPVICVISSVINHYYMTTTNQKEEILRSLSNLDAFQSELVLNYINGLLYVRQRDAYHYSVKRHQAMKEIGQALGKAGSWM